MDTDLEGSYTKCGGNHGNQCKRNSRTMEKLQGFETLFSCFPLIFCSDESYLLVKNILFFFFAVNWYPYIGRYWQFLDISWYWLLYSHFCLPPFSATFNIGYPRVLQVLQLGNPLIFEGFFSSIPFSVDCYAVYLVGEWEFCEDPRDGWVTNTFFTMIQTALLCITQSLINC